MWQCRFSSGSTVRLNCTRGFETVADGTQLVWLTWLTEHSKVWTDEIFFWFDENTIIWNHECVYHAKLHESVDKISSWIAFWQKHVYKVFEWGLNVNCFWCYAYTYLHANWDMRYSISEVWSRHPWYSDSVLDCWPTGRAVDPAPGAWFITKFISFTQVVAGPA